MRLAVMLTDLPGEQNSSPPTQPTLKSWRGTALSPAEMPRLPSEPGDPARCRASGRQAGTLAYFMPSTTLAQGHRASLTPAPLGFWTYFSSGLSVPLPFSCYLPPQELCAKQVLRIGFITGPSPWGLPSRGLWVQSERGHVPPRVWGQASPSLAPRPTPLVRPVPAEPGGCPHPGARP